MNRDRRTHRPRQPYRLQVPRIGAPAEQPVAELDRGEIAPWVIAHVRAWPASVEDRLVAIALGVQLQHVQQIRKAKR